MIRENGQKCQTSHPPDLQRRVALSQARPQRVKARGGINRTSCGPFAPRMDLGERETPLAIPISQNFSGTLGVRTIRDQAGGIFHHAPTRLGSSWQRDRYPASH